MIKKFLTFFNLSSLDFENGNAKLSLTEEQIEKSANLISERDEALQEIKDLQITMESMISELEEKLNAAESENLKLKAEIETLRNLPGSISALSTQATDGKNTDRCKIITDTSKSIAEQFDDFSNALKNNS